MNVSLWGISCFTFAFCVHWAIWRLRMPKVPIKTLVILFCVAGLLGFLFLFHFGSDTFPKLLHFVFLYFSMFLTYLLIYSAIEADSPSLVILLRIAEAGASGLPCQALKDSLTNDLLVLPRLEDLVAADLVDLRDSTYAINKKGRCFVWPFMLYRKFLGLGKGG